MEQIPQFCVGRFLKIICVDGSYALANSSKLLFSSVLGKICELLVRSGEQNPPRLIFARHLTIFCRPGACENDINPSTRIIFLWFTSLVFFF